MKPSSGKPRWLLRGEQRMPAQRGPRRIAQPRGTLEFARCGPLEFARGMGLGHVLSLIVHCRFVSVSWTRPRQERDRGETRRGPSLSVRCLARATHTHLHPQGPHSECLATPWGKEHTSTITVCVRVLRVLRTLLLYENMVSQGLCQSYPHWASSGRLHTQDGWLRGRPPLCT